MSKRRGTRLVRQNMLSGDTTTLRDIITNPSGTTLHAATKNLTITGVTATSVGAKVNFGQGTAYKVYRGAAPVSMNAPSGGARLSAGTVHIATGLTTLSSFTWNLQYSAASPNHFGYPAHMWFKSGTTAGSVVMYLYTPGSGVTFTTVVHQASACTPGRTISWTGTTIHWVAVGT